jgi:hypothetical protein
MISIDFREGSWSTGGDYIVDEYGGKAWTIIGIAKLKSFGLWDSQGQAPSVDQAMQRAAELSQAARASEPLPPVPQEAAERERARIRAILTSAETQGRMPYAIALATGSDLTPDQAKALLAASPKQATVMRAADSPIGLVTADMLDGPHDPNALSPEQVAERANAEQRAKRGDCW